MCNGKTRSGRSFGFLNATQFCGALNDNLFKLLLMFYLIAERGEAAASQIVAAAGVVFVLPFLLFSASAGVLADRVSKRNIIVAAKFTEVVVMSLGALAFLRHSTPGLYGVLFIMAAQSALFGPAKYGIVPELVGKDRLSRANGLLQAMTYLAIIIGTALAPFVSQATGRNYPLAALLCIAVAVLGLLASLPIERTAPSGATRKASIFFLRDIGRTLASIRRDSYLLMAVIASAYFLLLGAFMQMNLIPYAIQQLGLSQEGGSYLFLLAALGIGIGSLLAAALSGRNVEIGVVPLGAIGLAASSILLGALQGGIPFACSMIALLGLSAGLFIVPLQAWIQFRSPRRNLGEILAASSFLSWVGVLIAAGLIHLFGATLHLSARQGFLAIGCMTLTLTLVTIRMLPDFLVRLVGVLVMRLCYRVKVVGAAHVPLEGPALLVCNHVSWIDALLLMATQQRRIRFLAERSTFGRPLAGPVMRLLGVIPISSADPGKRIATALETARKALDEGWLVCIFGEGAITRTGVPRAFRSGLERIVAGTHHPIIPVYLGGAWGSIFSYYRGQMLSHLPLSFPYPVTVLFGRPMPSTATSGDVRQAVLELSCDYFNDKKATRRPLAEDFVRCARRNWSRRAVADSSGSVLSYGRTLAGAVALADIVRARTAADENVGLLLPPSVGGVLANLAVTLCGRTAVNLNYTASAGAFQSALTQCAIRTVFSSRRFLEKLGPVPAPDGTVFLEDLLPAISRRARLCAWLRARFVPARLLARPAGFDADRTATIIFSSGSTGEPKGVELSHHNILSNIESSRMVFNIRPEDCVCGVLPFFHSFGYTATFWLPLLCGFAAVYHANPMDGATVATLCREHQATLLFATPTFLMTYVRRAAPADFRHLRMVVVGAEKLKPRVADAFEEKFGLRPLEGYGATELAPIATINIPNVEIDGVRQVGVKEGTVGHPLPGVAVRIVNPDTFEPLGQGEPGLMLVRGPNVMRGYLGRPDKTREVLRDGWYNTGDIAVIDRDGFVQITDRLSRFSKIGGEMVPHVGVEDALHAGLRKTDPVLVVTSVPDERKGEKLVVLFTPAAGSAAEVKQAIADASLPNLWKPAPNAVFVIDELPLLGSGKLDLTAIKRMAAERMGCE